MSDTSFRFLSFVLVRALNLLFSRSYAFFVLLVSLCAFLATHIGSPNQEFLVDLSFYAGSVYLCGLAVLLLTGSFPMGYTDFELQAYPYIVALSLGLMEFFVASLGVLLLAYPCFISLAVFPRCESHDNCQPDNP